MPSSLYPSVRASWHAPTEGAVLVLAVLGLGASFGTMLSFITASKAQIGADPFYYAEIVKGPLYYILHAAEILLLLSAGVLALSCTNRREMANGFLGHFVLFLAAGGLMAVKGYTLEDLFSQKLVDATGPFMCLISVVLFVAVRRSNWPVIDKAFLVTAAVLSTVTLYEIAGLGTTSRVEAVRCMLPVVNALFWPASWTALRPYPRSSGVRYMRFAPAAVYGLGSLFTEMRLNFVMLFALLFLCAYADRQRGRWQAPAWLAALGMTAWLLLFSLVFLAETPAFEKVEGAAEGFYSRLDEDSRSGQLREFFRSVKPQELLFGRGSFATWRWGRGEWNGGTDVGYLNLLFYGGVPLLLSYFAVHMAPSLAALRRKPTGLQLTAGGVVLLWAIRMFSSANPGLTLEYYPILLCVGMCVSRGAREISAERSCADSELVLGGCEFEGRFGFCRPQPTAQRR